MRRLSRFSAILVLVFISTTLSTLANPPIIWDYNGIPLRQGHHIEWQRAGAMDDFGNVCYVWSDTRFGDRDVFAQKYDADGNELWEEGGITVVQASIRQEDPDICSDLQNGFIISWIDFRADTLGDVYVQRLDADGNRMWAWNGVPICLVPNSEQLMLHTISDGNSGAIIVWHDTRSDEGDLYAHHIRSDGTVDPNWNLDGNIVAKYWGDQGGVYGQSVDTDGAGGVIVAWSDARTPADPDIYAQRITIDGDLAWADTLGLPICAVPSEQKQVKLAPDGNGGAYMVWFDKRNYELTREDLYIQRINSNGAVRFQANGIPLVTQPNKQELARIVYDGLGGAIMVWEDFRNDNLVSDIYAQRIDSVGQKMWGDDDLMVCNAPENQRGARIFADGNGGAVTAWSDERNGAIPYSDLYAQKLLPNGSTAWETNGLVVSAEDYLQDAPLVRIIQDGSIFIAWSDARLGSAGIYHQLLNPDGAPLLTPGGEMVVWGLDGDATLPRIIKSDDPTRERLMVIWQDQRYVHLGNFIYQQVVGLTGEIAFPFNGKPVAIEYSAMDDLGNQINPQITGDGSGGAIVCWEDYRLINYSIPQIYAQRVDDNGNPMWDSTGVRICSTAFNQTFPYMCSDDMGGAFITWRGWNNFLIDKTYVAKIDANGIPTATLTFTNNDDDERVFGIGSDGSGNAILYWRGGYWETNEYNIYAARLNADCDSLWMRFICDAPDDQTNLVGAPHSQGGMVFAWSDKRSGADFDIYAQWLNENGEPQWENNGVVIISEAYDQTPTNISQDGMGNFFITWNDTRNGLNNDVYMQKIDGSTGNLMFQVGGVPVNVDPGGDQWAADIIVDCNDGLHICWEDMDPLVGAEILASHFDSDGNLHTGWSEGGDPVCTAYNNQINPAIMEDFYDGVVSAWEDARSSGKQVIYNLYMQRWNENPGVLVNGHDNFQPDDFTLSQNYPNPFNPQTQINFTLRETGKVKLAIYDVLGREVVKLKDSFMDSGSHRVIWNGRNSAGELTASGIYYYRLEFNGEMKVMKMILLK
ncbi:MAG: T9SS type A sorting domain-containing protein [candidate division Zixibacteria bacterium]|nr:T9SS type A sorting domain-containing protein [Candidatus Tariuqbacter arcticus]